METVILTVILLLAGGILAGYAMHRSDFCIAGMFRDLFFIGPTPRLKALTVLILANMALFHLGHSLGLLPDIPFPWYTLPNLIIFPGGVLFGIGMVLAGGCVIGILYRMGSGQILSWVAFAGMLIGSLIFIFTADYTAPFSEALKVNAPKTIPETAGLNPWFFLAPILLAGGYWITATRRKRSLLIASQARGFMQPVTAALLISLVSFISYYLVNAPIGVTSSYTKFGSWFVHMLAPDIYSSTELFSKTVVKYHNPFTDSIISGSLGITPDGISLVQYPAIGGIILGAFISAVIIGEFRPRFFLPPRQYLSALAGGILLGYSSRIAAGCNIWHVLGGVPILAWGGFIFLAGMVAGAWIGSRILLRWVVT